jgi:hypothetical protein
MGAYEPDAMGDKCDWSRIQLRHRQQASSKKQSSRTVSATMNDIRYLPHDLYCIPHLLYDRAMEYGCCGGNADALVVPLS